MYIDIPCQIHRVVLIVVMLCLMVMGSSCNQLLLIPLPTKTPTPLPSSTPTLEECSWSGYALAWNDINGNGIQDANEPPMSDVRFFTEGYMHQSEIFDWGITGTGGSMGLIILLSGCPDLEFEVYPHVPENCQLTTPARILAHSKKEHEKFSFGFLCH